jgi:hypothetical protein
MKQFVRSLLIFIFLCTVVNTAQAGFWVKTHTAATTTSTTANARATELVTRLAKNSNVSTEQMNQAVKKLSPRMYHNYRQSEWISIAALVFGLLGLFVPGVNFLAILFGVLGLGRGSKVRGLAMAGFILGILELILFLIAGTTFLSYILL